MLLHSIQLSTTAASSQEYTNPPSAFFTVFHYHKYLQSEVNLTNSL